MDRRRSVRKWEREVATADELPELPVPPEVENLGDSQQLQRALAQLPGGQREALLLHHVWGFSFKEVGATLGVRSGTAKLRAHRGILELRKLLGAFPVT
jgi:RNA polymerase sigma-70 factor (ECF subfamily)